MGGCEFWAIPSLQPIRHHCGEQRDETDDDQQLNQCESRSAPRPGIAILLPALSASGSALPRSGAVECESDNQTNMSSVKRENIHAFGDDEILPHYGIKESGTSMGLVPQSAIPATNHFSTTTTLHYSRGMPDDFPLPNYRSIAKESGVGKSTVGRVLQNSGYVSDEVRNRVLDAARRLGYRPDPALGALSRRRWPGGAQPKTATLAYIYHGVSISSTKAPPEFHGAKQRAEELGYAVDTFSLADYPSLEVLNRVLHARGIQGVLVQAFRDNVHLDLEWPHFFTVFIGPENDLARVHNVQADFRSALHQAIQVCRERGYRKIGMTLMNHAASGTNIPFQAQALYEKAVLEREIGPQPEILTYEPSRDWFPNFSRWFRAATPDVVVSTNIQPHDWLTAASHYDRRQKNRNIPGDVGFVCTRGSSGTPHIAFMDLREREQGRQAVDLVHPQLQHGAIGKPEIPLRLLIPPLFVDGPSVIADR